MLTTHPIAYSLLPFLYNTERFCVLAKFKKLRNALLISRVMNLFIREVQWYIYSYHLEGPTIHVKFANM